MDCRKEFFVIRIPDTGSLHEAVRIIADAGITITRCHYTRSIDPRTAFFSVQGRPDGCTRAQEALSKLRPIAERHGVTLGQLALAWVIVQPETAAIVGARNAEQAVQNAGASDVQLSLEDLAEMETISRIVTDHLDENPVLWAF